MSMKPTTDHLTRAAIKEASLQGCDAQIVMNHAMQECVVSVQLISTGKRIKRTITDVDLALHGDVTVAVTINQLVYDLHKEPTQTQTEHELARYKEIVKQLAFELEMAQGTKPDVVERVRAIRKAALEQAAEFVMDWGIPRDGKDFEELCKQIPKLKETKAMIVQRGLGAMTAAFGGKQ